MIKSHEKEQGQLVSSFAEHLRREERSANTILKYSRDLRHFFLYLQGRALTKELLLDWKDQLISTHAPASVNSMLAAVNCYLEWNGQTHLKVKPLKIQRAIFCKPERELTRIEYQRLVKTAERQCNQRLALLLQTICATGIRVSELQYVTVEALKLRRAIVDCKGKTRTVFLPRDLCIALQTYCRGHHIHSGFIFRTKKGLPLHRSNIWREMKSLCENAGVRPEKVFPHNLRHLFAKIYYQLEKDVFKLADLLGHSNINTTRIYTMESEKRYTKQLERMGLVLF